MEIKYAFQQNVQMAQPIELYLFCRKLILINLSLFLFGHSTSSYLFYKFDQERVTEAYELQFFLQFFNLSDNLCYHCRLLINNNNLCVKQSFQKFFLYTAQTPKI